MKIAFVARQPGTAHAFANWIKCLHVERPYWDLQAFCYPEAVGHMPARTLSSEADLQMQLELWHPACIVTGTSLTVNEDADCWRWAKSKGISCVAVAESWVNLPERFMLDGALVGPDCIGVPDVAAASILINAGFAPSRITVIGNPLLDDASVRNISSQRRDRLLFVSEPPLPEMGEQKFREKFGQIDTDIFVHLLPVLEKDSDMRAALIIRLHPRDSRESFLMRARASIAHFGMPPTLLDTEFIWDRDNKEDSLAATRLVVGLGSMLLHEAAVSGLPVAALRYTSLEAFPELIVRSGVTRLAIDENLGTKLKALWEHVPAHGRQQECGDDRIGASCLRLMRKLEEMVNE